MLSSILVYAYWGYAGMKIIDPQLSLSSIMCGCPVSIGDTIYFACTSFNMFGDTGSDAPGETFFDSVMPEMMNLLLRNLISQGLW